MPESRKGHHGDWLYVFEDAGYDTTPTDTIFKPFGSDTVADTFESGYQAARTYNAGRRAAEIIEQNFDGAWGASFNLGATPPWWLAGIYGDATSTLVAGALYEYTFGLDNGNDPVPLRLYAPTDGFNNYLMIPGAYIVSVSVDQSEDGMADVSLTGGYARKPDSQLTPAVSAPNFTEQTFRNRHAEVVVGGTTIGRSQSTSISLETGTEGVSEIGTENMVDFVPGAFEPSITYDKIKWVGESVDMYSRFDGGAEVAVSLNYDNGQTGDDQYAVEFDFTGSFPDQWSESGRNDPEADLIEELQDMAKDATVLLTTTEGAGTVPGL